jgi:hypothetical protein
MAQLVLPRVQAMVLCDGLKESEEEPDVVHLAGVRTHVLASSFFFENSIKLVSLYFRVRNCVFPAPGVYYVQVFWRRQVDR